MKTQTIAIIAVIATLTIISCGGSGGGASSVPTEYLHDAAGFKITAPAGWEMMDKSVETYEFRQGDYMLIEVGGFDLGKDLYETLNDPEFDYPLFLEDASLGFLKDYCKEAAITGYRVTLRNETSWGGMPAFRLKAEGFSAPINKTVTIDVLLAVNKSSCVAYVFASQIAKSKYDEASGEIETSIASFQVI